MVLQVLEPPHCAEEVALSLRWLVLIAETGAQVRLRASGRLDRPDIGLQERAGLHVFEEAFEEATRLLEAPLLSHGPGEVERDVRGPPGDVEQLTDLQPLLEARALHLTHQALDLTLEVIVRLPPHDHPSQPLLRSREPLAQALAPLLEDLTDETQALCILCRL